MATLPELKFLQRLAKRGKGSVDMDVAADTLRLIGFDVQTTFVALDLGKYSDGDAVVSVMLKDWGQRHGLRHISGPRYGDPKEWVFRFEPQSDPKAAARELEGLVVTVATAPTDPELGTLYITSLRSAVHELFAKNIWLGDAGWTLTAPSGKMTTISSPVSRRGIPIPGSLNLAPFWTFLYKNGAAEAAKAYLDTQSREEVEELTASKAERERISRRRSSLPEIKALFVAITEERYDEVVEWLRSQYVGTVETTLRIQKERGRLDHRTWANLQGAHDLMKQEYDHNNQLHWVVKPNYQELALTKAKLGASAAREAFVDKNTFRISEISRLKGMVPDAEILSVEPGPTFNSRMRFSFSDGSSFELRNKTVWKTSPLGVFFAQFPTTFHDVVLPDGKRMSQPSEARMIDVFAGRGAGKTELKKLKRMLLR